MEISLKPIQIEDINMFDQTEYGNLTKEKRIKLVTDSIKGESCGKYFKFYLIFVDNVNVGFINVCGHSKSVVSVAPEIKQSYRKKGYAFSSMKKALDLVKEQGYKIAVAGIKIDNVASQKLQEKLGFEYVQNVFSKNGNQLKYYVKQL